MSIVNTTNLHINYYLVMFMSLPDNDNDYQINIDWVYVLLNNPDPFVVHEKEHLHESTHLLLHLLLNLRDS